MLTGRFGDTSRRPFLEGRIYLPRQRSLCFDVSFLVDTGADRTMLMPDDGRASGLNYSQLTGNETIGGVGGPLSCFEEDAIVVLSFSLCNLE